MCRSLSPRGGASGEREGTEGERREEHTEDKHTRRKRQSTEETHAQGGGNGPHAQGGGDGAQGEERGGAREMIKKWKFEGGLGMTGAVSSAPRNGQ